MYVWCMRVYMIVWFITMFLYACVPRTHLLSLFLSLAWRRGCTGCVLLFGDRFLSFIPSSLSRLFSLPSTSFFHPFSPAPHQLKRALLLSEGFFLLSFLNHGTRMHVSHDPLHCTDSVFFKILQPKRSKKRIERKGLRLKNGVKDLEKEMRALCRKK